MSKDLIPSAAFAATLRGAYAYRITASVYRWQSGANTAIQTDIPVLDGELTLDSAAPTRRFLTLRVAGLGEPTNSDHPLAPFGQYVILRVSVRVNETGLWVPIKLGEFPILTTTHERPTGITTLRCGDWSTRVEEYRLTSRIPASDWSRKQLDVAIRTLVDQALPDKVYAVHQTGDTKRRVGEEVGNINEGRWTYAQRLAERVGSIKGDGSDVMPMECFFDSNGDLVLRKSWDDDDPLPGAGPDIGDVTNPVAILNDGPGGVISRITSEISREGGVNGVVVVVQSIAQWEDYKKKPANRRPPKEYFGNYRTDHLAPSTSSIAYGDKFGRLPITEVYRKRFANDPDNQKWARRRARYLYSRRRGLVRLLDIEAAPLWYLEPDDRVKVQWETGSGRADEAHYVQRVTFGLSPEQASMRVLTRSLNVTDPG
jgi:hypothetical protein